MVYLWKRLSVWIHHFVFLKTKQINFQCYHVLLDDILFITSGCFSSTFLFFFNTCFICLSNMTIQAGFWSSVVLRTQVEYS